jgi:signal transduction histidine kinase
MLSIPGLKDLIRTRDGRKGLENRFAGLFGSRVPDLGDLPAYLAFLAERLGIGLLALIEKDGKGESALIRVGSKGGLTCELTLPRLEDNGTIGGLIEAGEPAFGKARVFSKEEVFPVGEAWCDIIPMDSAVSYAFIPLAGMPLPQDTSHLENASRCCYVLATHENGDAEDEAFPLKVTLCASLVGTLLMRMEQARDRTLLSILTNILKEEGYSIGFVDDRGEALGKSGDALKCLGRDVLERIGQADTGVPGAAETKDAGRATTVSRDDARVTVRTYPVSAPGRTSERLVAVKESDAAARMLTRRERLKLLSRLMSSVAHEIKNPLTGIAAGIQYLARKIQPGLEEDETVEFILSEINRLNRIVDDLYKIARPPELVMKQIDLKGVLNRSLICLSEDIARKRLVVEQDTGAEIPQFEADADRLQQIFINIIKNAVEASPEGGTLRLEVGQNDSRAIIRITDSGPGISREDRERIFEPFFTTKERGSGLGLCISQRIVDEHGGSIRVDTPPGGGTSFVIEIPIRR